MALKLECPDCSAVVTAKGDGAVRCPRCGFTARAPNRATTRPAQSPTPPAAPANAPAPASPTAGSQPEFAPRPAARPHGQTTNGLAIAALVTGIVGFIGFPPAAIAAIILGIIGMNQCKETGQSGHGMALTGLILGVLVAVFWLILFSTILSVFP